jgi:hypothetical protein
VSTEIAKARQNIEDRIENVKERVAAAEGVLPQWLEQNGSALNSGLAATQSSIERRVSARGQFVLANAAAATACLVRT